MQLIFIQFIDEVLKQALKLICLFFLLSISVSKATDLIDSEFNYKFGIGFNYASLSSYYNNNGVVKEHKPDIRTITIMLEDKDSSFTVPGRTNLDYTESHNQYFSEFKLSNNLKVGLNLDLAYYSMENSFSFEDTLRDEAGLILQDQFGNAVSNEVTLDDPLYKIFRLMYINPKLDYYLLNDKVTYLVVGLNALVPLSFDKREEYIDNRFLDDGYFQLNTNIQYLRKYETTSLELSGGYIHRSEIYSDLANANIGVYFTKVENAYLLIKAEYFQSLDEPNNQDFIISELPSFESYLNMKFGLNVNFEQYEFQLDYNFVPWGKSYWVMNRLNASFQYYLK